MNRNYYPGRHLHSENNVVKKIVTFDKIRTMFETGELVKPVYQGALEEERVNGMVSSYLKHPEYFQFKNTIVVGDINKQFYIIDGQHRVEMVSILCKKHYKYKWNNFVSTVEIVNKRKGLNFSKVEKKLLQKINSEE